MVEAFFSDSLRGFLLLIGVVVVIGVYLLSRRRSKRLGTGKLKTDVPPVNDARGVVQGVVQGAVNGVRKSPPIAAAVKNRTAADHSSQAVTPAGQTPVAETLDERVLVLHVRAKAGHKFKGDDILRIAEGANLERASSGAGGFFEYFGTQRVQPDSDVEARPLFYVANMFSPGVFDFQRMNSFSTTGLSLFAQLPGALPAPEIFDSLLAHARLFAESLRGSILDENHHDMTPQTIRSIKDTLQFDAE